MDRSIKHRLKRIDTNNEAMQIKSVTLWQVGLNHFREKCQNKCVIDLRFVLNL